MPEDKTITINIKEMSGPRLFSLVMSAVKRRSKETGKPVSKAEFCRAADLTRSALHSFKNGQKPGPEACIKVGNGLKEWGNIVEIEL